MNGINSCLWFDCHAEDAARFCTSVSTSGRYGGPMTEWNATGKAAGPLGLAGDLPAAAERRLVLLPGLATAYSGPSPVPVRHPRRS